MKLRSICKSKIHHALVTGADLNYIGSIGIDRTLMFRNGLSDMREFIEGDVRFTKAFGMEVQ